MGIYQLDKVMSYNDGYQPRLDPVWNKPPFWEPKDQPPVIIENGRKRTWVSLKQSDESVTVYGAMMQKQKLTATCHEVLDCIRKGFKTIKEMKWRLHSRSANAIASAIKILRHKGMIKGSTQRRGLPATYELCEGVEA